MADQSSRRDFVRDATVIALFGVAGCTEPSEEGTPPADEPPSGPVEDQDGAANQTPGRGPAGGPGEENESWTDEGDAGAADPPDDEGDGEGGGDGGGGEGGGGGGGEGGGDDGGGGGDGGDDAAANESFGEEAGDRNTADNANGSRGGEEDDGE